jgi:hypothetical protein
MKNNGKMILDILSTIRAFSPPPFIQLDFFSPSFIWKRGVDCERCFYLLSHNFFIWKICKFSWNYTKITIENCNKIIFCFNLSGQHIFFNKFWRRNEIMTQKVKTSFTIHTPFSERLDGRSLINKTRILWLSHLSLNLQCNKVNSLWH